MSHSGEQQIRKVIGNMRKGNVLTVFRKVKGQWVLSRDANLLAPA
jgi:hypothetical protein